MKAGYHGNTALQQRLERADSGVRPIVQAVVTTSEDVIDTKGEWNQADSTSLAGIDVLDIGAIRLTGSAATYISQTTNDTDLTSLSAIHAPPFDVAVVEWSGVTSAETIEIHTVTARLNPDTGAGKNVVTWRCQLWRLARVGARDVETDTAWELEPLCNVCEVTAGGVTADVIFDFSGYDHPIWPGPAPEVRGDVPVSSQYHYATTLVHIWGIQSDGAVATNVAWRADSSGPQKVVSGHVVTHKVMAEIAADQEQYQSATVFDEQDGTACPYLVIKGRTYAGPRTVMFSGSTNLIDLGSTSLNTLECISRAAEFSGSAVTFQIASTSSTFMTFADGDLIGTDNSSAGGYDLSSLGAAQKWKMRATLTPSTDGQATPVVYEMGVRNISKTDLDGLVNIGSCRWAVDPVSLKGEIPEISLEFLRDGILDYRDVATQILSENHINAVDYDLWIGHPDLDRRRWLFIDRFVEDDRETAGPGITLTCVSRLANLRNEVPPVVNSTGSTSVKERRPVEYSGTAKAIYDDLISNQIALASRFIGPGIESTRTYSRNLKDIKPGKVYLDQLAYLEGGSVISSQGRLKFVSFYNTDIPNPNSTGSQLGPAGPIRARFPQEEIQELSVTPGFGARITDYTVFHGWDDLRDNGKGSFSGEVRRISTATVEKVGRALIEIKTSEDDDICRWIESSTAGSTSADWLARRIIQRFGHGLILVSFRTTYPKPWLEPGDLVSIESDRLVARDPHSDKAIRGRNWMRGRIVGVHDVMGTQFTAWVESYSDFTGSQTNVNWTHYANPDIRDIAVAWSSGMSPTYFVVGNRDAKSVKVAQSASTYPNKAAVRTMTAHALSTDKTVSFASTATYNIGDKFYISGLAYETSTGGGAESIYRYMRTFTRDNVPSMTIFPLIGSTRDVSAIVTLNELARSFKLDVNTRASTAAPNYPTSTDVRASTMMWNGTGSVGTTTIGTLATLSSGQVADISGLAYGSTGGTGAEGQLVTATANPYLPKNSVGSDQLIDGHVLASKMDDSASKFYYSGRLYSTDYNSIRWTAGTLFVVNGGQYSISADQHSGVWPGASVAKYIYWDPDVATGAFQYSQETTNAFQDNTILIGVAWKGPSTASDAPVIPISGRGWFGRYELGDGCITTDKILANAVTADQLAANSVTAAKVAAASISALAIQSHVIGSCHIDVGTLDISDTIRVGDSSGGPTRYHVTVDASTEPSVTWGDIAEADLVKLKLSSTAADAVDLTGTIRQGTLRPTLIKTNAIEWINFVGTTEMRFTNATTTGGAGNGRITVSIGGLTRYLSFDT